MRLGELFGLRRKEASDNEQARYAFLTSEVKRYPENTFFYVHYNAPYTNVDYIFRWAMHSPRSFSTSGVMSPAIRDKGNHLFAKPPILSLEYRKFGEVYIPTVDLGFSNILEENEAVEFIIDPLVDNAYIEEEISDGLARHNLSWYREVAEKIIRGV